MPRPSRDCYSISFNCGAVLKGGIGDVCRELGLSQAELVKQCLVTALSSESRWILRGGVVLAQGCVRDLLKRGKVVKSDIIGRL